MSKVTCPNCDHQFETVVGRPRRWDEADQEEMLRLWAQGATLEEIGEVYSLTRERIRQILSLHPNYQQVAMDKKVNREIRLAELKAQTNYRKLMERLPKVNKRCAVCGSWVIRPGGSQEMTCSKECAIAWRSSSARYHFDEAVYHTHRLQMARSILKNPEGKVPSRIAWAHKMLSDNPPPPNRRYWIEGSESSKVAKAKGKSLVRRTASAKPRKPRRKAS